MVLFEHSMLFRNLEKNIYSACCIHFDINKYPYNIN